MLFKWTGLSWLDRLLGGVFGLVRGSVIAVAFVAVLLAFTAKPLPQLDGRVENLALRDRGVESVGAAGTQRD